MPQWNCHLWHFHGHTCQLKSQVTAGQRAVWQDALSHSFATEVIEVMWFLPSLLAKLPFSKLTFVDLLLVCVTAFPFAVCGIIIGLIVFAQLMLVVLVLLALFCQVAVSCVLLWLFIELAFVKLWVELLSCHLSAEPWYKKVKGNSQWVYFIGNFIISGHLEAGSLWRLNQGFGSTSSLLYRKFIYTRVGRFEVWLY